jgi:hypothetical protein
MPVASALLAASGIQGTRTFYGDHGIARMTAARALYEGLVRIPLGTALPEELIFRGALQSLLARRHHPLLAAGLTSILFGLWHIAPAFRRLQTHALTIGRHPAHQTAWVATSIGFTTLAGLALTGLRYRSRSLVAPWLVHSAVNAAGLAAAWLTAARSGQAAAAYARDVSEMASTPERAASTNAP